MQVLVADRDSQDRRVLLAGVLGWSLILFASKLWLIGTYGNNTPFWDQWDAQAAFLFSPRLHGQLGLEHLFAAHNEHRILTTRLLALLLLEANGQWSPLLEMCVNAALHVMVVVSAALLLGRATGERSAPAVLMAAGALLNCLPFAWENTLAGFQSQFYFVVLLSLWAIWLLQSAPFTARWWGGVFLCVLAYFSLASGVFAAAAGACSIALRAFVGRARRYEWQAALLLLGLFAAGYSLTPLIQQHDYLRAHSVLQFSDATWVSLSWPFYTDEMALVRNAPLALLVGVLIAQRPGPEDARWYIAAVGGWAMLQSLGLAIGRAQGVLASRYLDLHAMALLANAAALLAVAVPALRSVHRRAAFVALVAWGSVCLCAGINIAGNAVLARTLAMKREQGMRQQEHLASFLRTRDFASIAHLRPLELPYPSARRLADITSDPRLVAILPGELQPVAPGSQPSGRLAGLVDLLLGHWSWLLGLGLACVAFSLAAAVLGAPALLPARGRPIQPAAELRTSER